MNSKKTIAALACIGSVLAFGENSTNKQETVKIETQQPEKLTLIGKKMIYCDNPENDRASLFFDTDGNTNTTEVVVHTSMCETKSEAAIFDAKIGETKTKQEWTKKIPITPLPNNIFTAWSYVKEK